MKISKNGQYALISVADISIHAEDSHVSISNIARRQNIDPRLVSQIFFVLKNAGILLSVRGKNGGYYLSRDASKITAGEVVRAIEGGLAPTLCSLDENASQNCETFDACFTRTLWQRIAQEINETLDSITIADITEEYKRKFKQ